MSKKFKSVYTWTKRKKGKPDREVFEEEHFYKSNKELKKRFKSKFAKTYWTGKNFNKRRINER